MDFVHIAAAIVVALLALYVVYAIRHPGYTSARRERYDAEHPHPFSRAWAAARAARTCLEISSRRVRHAGGGEAPRCCVNTAHAVPSVWYTARQGSGRRSIALARSLHQRASRIPPWRSILMGS